MYNEGEIITIINKIKYKEINDNNINVIFSDESYAKATLIYASEALKEVSYKLGLDKSIFQSDIKIYLALNRKEFEYLVLNILNVNIKIPTSKGRIAQPQRTELILLCPSVYETDSIYKYNEDEYKRLIVHEIIHMFHEKLSIDMENISRWFSEGIAIYYSNQYKYEDEFRNPVIEGIRYNNIPGIRDIEKDITLCYDWGWTIVAYIEEAYGRETILDIMKNCCSNDVMGFMKEEIEIFEEKWITWLKYNII